MKKWICALVQWINGFDKKQVVSGLEPGRAKTHPLLLETWASARKALVRRLVRSPRWFSFGCVVQWINGFDNNMSAVRKLTGLVRTEHHWRHHYERRLCCLRKDSCGQADQSIRRKIQCASTTGVCCKQVYAHKVWRLIRPLKPEGGRLVNLPLLFMRLQSKAGVSSLRFNHKDSTQQENTHKIWRELRPMNVLLLNPVVLQLERSLQKTEQGFQYAACHDNHGLHNDFCCVMHSCVYVKKSLCRCICRHVAHYNF